MVNDQSGCIPQYNFEFPKCFELYKGSSTGINPGNIQNIHFLANRIKPKFFDGLILDYSHRLATNKIIKASWTLSHNMPGGIRFGGIYTARNHQHILQTPTIHADINPSTLSTNVGIVYFPFRCLRLQAELQRASAEAPLQTRSTIEYSGNRTTVTANLYNVSRDNGRSTLSLLHAVTNHIALGGEILLEWTDPDSIMTDTALAARYRLHHYAVAMTLSRQGVDLSYWQRLHPKIQMGTMWAWQRKTQKSLGTICYRWDFKDAYVKGLFDSNLSVGFLYERIISDLPVSVAMSLFMNLHSNRFIFGLKFILDPSGYRRNNDVASNSSTMADVQV